MKTFSAFLILQVLLVLGHAFSSVSWAGPQCDQLVRLQSQESACESHAQYESLNISTIKNEIQEKVDDMNNRQNLLNSCKYDLAQTEGAIPVAQQQLGEATLSANEARARQAEEQAHLDQLTQAIECVGMDQKYAQTLRTFGRTEAEARAHLASPNTLGMGVADVAKVNSYLSMAKKHGALVFCQRNFVTQNPGQFVLTN